MGGAAAGVAASRNALAKAAASGQRSSGRLAKARATTASKPRGAVAESTDGATGSVFSALCSTAENPPSKGFSPVSSWYSTTPAAQRSARASTVSPRSCSGAI